MTVLDGEQLKKRIDAVNRNKLFIVLFVIFVFLFNIYFNINRQKQSDECFKSSESTIQYKNNPSIRTKIIFKTFETVLIDGLKNKTNNQDFVLIVH